MSRAIAIAPALLVLVAGFTLEPSYSGIAHASRQLSEVSVPVESLPMIDSQGVSLLSPNAPGHYLGQDITHGLQLLPAGYTHATFDPAGKYSHLKGTVYHDDKSGASSGVFSIYDGSDPSNNKLILQKLLNPNEKFSFNLIISNVKVIYFAIDAGGNGGYNAFDVVAYFTSGSPSPTNVAARFPASGTALPLGNPVLFKWRAFPGAENYILQVWMIKQDGLATLTPTTPTAFSAVILGKTTYTWNTKSFFPGTYQYVLMALDAKGNVLAPRNNPTQFVLSS